jgi:hypothetical protein
MEGLEPSKTTAKMHGPSLVYSLYDITSAPSHPHLVKETVRPDKLGPRQVQVPSQSFWLGHQPLYAQSRQSAMLFLKLSELGLHQPLTPWRVCPPPPPQFWGRGWERPNSDERTYTVVLFIYTYNFLKLFILCDKEF